VDANVLPILLPLPQTLMLRAGQFRLPDVLTLESEEGLDAFADRLSAALQRWSCVTLEPDGAPPATVRVRLLPELSPRLESYRLHVTPEQIEIIAHDPAGAFYAACTLVQLAQQYGRVWPCLEIIDWPDFPARGVMLDVSRDKVYRMETLYALIDRLAGWKINQLQLYMEHTFAYAQHPLVWAEASPFTGEEIEALDQYCRARFIELVPNQNSFGHMARFLKLEPYAHLAEIHGVFQMPWGPVQGPFSLQPDHPGSLELVQGLHAELLPHFSSRMFNAGLDETHDVGQDATSERVAAVGLGRVYLDFFQKVYQSLTAQGRLVQFWGDIITHEPELVPELPRDAIALLWGYDLDHPFHKEGQQFAAAGLPFYVCPGTSSWTSLAGRTDNCLTNIRTAAEAGREFGAIGLLNTDWGDEGHWQQLPVSFLGLAAGASAAWNAAAPLVERIIPPLSRFAFDDPSGTMGRLAYHLGNIYQRPGMLVGNGSILFWILQLPLEKLREFMQPTVTPETLAATLLEVEQIAALLREQAMQRPDAALIVREFDLTLGLLRHAVRRAGLLLTADTPELRAELGADLHSILANYRALWLERSRPGGLRDSLARFGPMAAEYGIDLPAV
jgi:hypothetical protein